MKSAANSLLFMTKLLFGGTERRQLETEAVVWKAKIARFPASAVKDPTKRSAIAGTYIERTIKRAIYPAPLPDSAGSYRCGSGSLRATATMHRGCCRWDKYAGVRRLFFGGW